MEEKKLGIDSSSVARQVLHDMAKKKKKKKNKKLARSLSNFENFSRKVAIKRKV